MSPAPLPELAGRIKDALAQAARSALGAELPDLHLTEPPSSHQGDYATASCLPLARQLRKSPREIAQAVVDAAGAIPGVRKLEVAGPGYVNVYLDR